MKATGRIILKMNPISRILKDKGLDENGDVQRFHTMNVLRRIQKYMPYRSGATIKLMVVQTDVSKPEIVLDVPYGKFLYYGMLMVDPVTGAAGFQDADGQWKSWTKRPKVKSDRPITYTKTKNPLAGPFWDRRLTAAEGKAMQADLQRYIDGKQG